MRLSRITVKNFRNFEDLDISLNNDAIILGENGAGKSNLVFALRLLLDPTLPNSVRHLDPSTDFWSGISRPLTNTDEILISVEFQDFDNDDVLLATLGDYLCSTEPMTARLNYLFRPKPHLDRAPESSSDYNYVIYGGDDRSKLVTYDVQRRIPVVFLDALRNVEGDLTSWKRSPLRPLISRILKSVSPSEFQEKADEIDKLTKTLISDSGVGAVSEAINEELNRILGSDLLNTDIGLSQVNVLKMLKNARLFLGDDGLAITDAGLGHANVIFFCIKLLELQGEINDEDKSHVIFVVEEPEAHLYPHLQRTLFRDLLSTREGSIPETRRNTSILLTTHSPHIASVTPIKSFVVLAKQKKTVVSVGYSTADIKITSRDVDDLARYLDVNRGEMLFSRGVLLVEGDAERFAVPKFAELLERPLDRLGISVCSVGGTNFLPYIKLLGTSGLNIPFAVITDGDPTATTLRVYNRAKKLLSFMNSELSPSSNKEISETANENGIFFNDDTFEISLGKSGGKRALLNTLLSLLPSDTVKATVVEWNKPLGVINYEKLLAWIESIGKGRFAQTLSGELTAEIVPPYIESAIRYLAGKVGG